MKLTFIPRNFPLLFSVLVLFSLLSVVAYSDNVNIAKLEEQSAKGDPTLLEGYSETCLRHVWNYQAFAVWINELMHDAGDPSYAGEFRKPIARAELQRQFT